MHGIIALSPWGYPGIAWGILRSTCMQPHIVCIACLISCSPRSGVHVFGWILEVVWSTSQSTFMLCFTGRQNAISQFTVQHSG